MKSDLNDLKKLTLELLQHGNSAQVQQDNEGLIHRIYGNDSHKNEASSPAYSIIPVPPTEKESYLTKRCTTMRKLRKKSVFTSRARARDDTQVVRTQRWQAQGNRQSLGDFGADAISQTKTV